MSFAAVWNSLVGFFLSQPAHAWALSAVFGVLCLAAFAARSRWREVSCLPLLVASLVWLAYGFWEREALVRKANIRLDIALIWPFLLVGTVSLIILSIQGLIRAVRATNVRQDGAD